MNAKTTTGLIMATATLAITIALGLNTVIIKQAFAGGSYWGSAPTFSPGQISGLSGTGQHAAKVFAPGQEAQASGASASDFNPGDVKKTTSTNPGGNTSPGLGK